MNTSRTQFITLRLQSLIDSVPDVLGAAVVSTDGLSIASVLQPPIDEDRVAAMSAAMLSLGERISSELGRGVMEQVYIKGTEGYALLVAVGPQAVLTIISGGEAKLGMLLLELRMAVADLGPLID
ncbi:MAG: roadblock/LC7 domain-containing protein [Anaerolineales bacterium]